MAEEKERIAPGTDAIHICPKCGRQVVKTEFNCAYCGEAIFGTKLNIEKTLFVTDLDGTLMQNDKSLSEYTINVLNGLIDEGMNITYATARTFSSAWKITKDIHFSLPVITRNGTVLANQALKTETEILSFSDREIAMLKELLQDTVSHSGFVTAYFDNEMTKRYRSDNLSAGMKNYILDHTDDKRMNALACDEDLFDGVVTYVTIIDTKEILAPIYDIVSKYDSWECVLQKDTYGDDYWLEICPQGATKAKAILRCMKGNNCENVVAFGDSVNDLSMFEVADEAYAVANALPEVKEKATKVIDSNEENGVAKCLLALWQNR